MGILGWLLVFTATLLNKRKDFIEYNRLEIRRVIMSASLKMYNESAKARTYRGTKTTTYKARIPGLEHIVSEYGKRKKPGSFKTMMKSMAQHMVRVGVLKKGRPEASKAIKNSGPGTRSQPNQLMDLKKKNQNSHSTTSDICKKNQTGKKQVGAFLRNYHLTALPT